MKSNTANVTHARPTNFPIVRIPSTAVKMTEYTHKFLCLRTRSSDEETHAYASGFVHFKPPPLTALYMTTKPRLFDKVRSATGLCWPPLLQLHFIPHDLCAEPSKSTHGLRFREFR